MLTPTAHLLNAAKAGGYAIGAVNIYNLEGVRAVIAAGIGAMQRVVSEELEAFGSTHRA